MKDEKSDDEEGFGDFGDENDAEVKHTEEE